MVCSQRVQCSLSKNTREERIDDLFEFFKIATLNNAEDKAR